MGSDKAPHTYSMAVLWSGDTRRRLQETSGIGARQLSKPALQLGVVWALLELEGCQVL